MIENDSSKVDRGIEELLREDLDWTVCEEEYELSKKLFGRFDKILTENKGRLDVLTRNIRIYSDVDDVGEIKNLSNCRLLQMIGVDSSDNLIDGEQNTHSYNVIRVCVNTLANKIGKGLLNPRVMTSGANFYVREKCKMADTFIKSALRKMNFPKEARRILFDACLHGSGIGKVCKSKGVDGAKDDIWVERTMLDEIFVELHDAYYGDPSRIYQMKFVSRKALANKFKSKAVEISKSESLPFEAFKGAATSQMGMECENVIIIEAWAKRGDGVDGKGRHILATSDAILVDEEWDKDYLPFIKLDYTSPLVGFFGEGIAHELLKLQKDLTDLDQYIDEAIHRVTAPKTFYNGTALIDEEAWTNSVGTLIKVDGLAPNVSPAQVLHTVSPTALSNEVYAYRTGKLKDAHDQCGVSQMSASGLKPAGLDSGAALREYNDIQSERFATFGLDYEEFTVKAVECIFRELEGLQYTVRNRVGTGLTKISFEDLSLDFDDIEIDVYPVSALPETPAGRLAAAKELQDLGLIPPDRIPDILKMPDLDGYFDIEMAPKKYVDKFLNRLLKNPKGDFSVDPMMDLEYLYAQCVKYYNYVRCDLEDAMDGNNQDRQSISAGNRLLDKLSGLAEAAKQMIKETQTPPAGEQAPVDAQMMGAEAQIAAMGAAGMPPMEGGGLPPMADEGGMLPPPMPM